MPTYDGFKSSVGVTLMESAGFRPWRAGLPAGLAGLRGWLVEVEPGACAVFVLGGDADEEGALPAQVTLWREAMAAFGVREAILLVVDAPLEASDQGPFQVWGVDLQDGSLERGGGPAPAGFAAVVEAAVRGALDDQAMTVADLVEEERARLAGRVPFGLFLASRTPVATYGLSVVILGMFLASTALSLVAAGLGPVAWGVEPGHVWAALQHTSPGALLWLGATMRPLVEQGEVWRLLAANYLHAGFLHLFVNAYSLHAIGPSLEKVFGAPKFLAVWVVAGGAGATASVVLNQHALSVGASGALFGLLGAMLVLGTVFRGVIPRYQMRTMRDVSLITLGINVILGATIPHIDNMAHLGGLLGGMAAAALLGPDPALLPGRRVPRWLPALWVFPLLAIVSVGWGLWAVWQGASPSLRVEDRAGGYRLEVPVGLHVERRSPRLIVTANGAQGSLRLESVQQGPGGLMPPVTVADVRARPEGTLRRLCAPGERPVGRAVVDEHGGLLVLTTEVLGPDGERETLSLSPGPRRLLVLRTRGLGREAWVRDVRARMLASLQHLPPR
ncbi:MAG: rhomboid family intramembrane serine protease [Candidatus Sericytochromatia bacterium]|nr:rhomboid family intramembrane serine protease [Candidatus Sericytochromatia bacterium]